MRVLILGATGRTGKHLLTEAIARGYDIHVLVRDKSKVSERYDGLRIFEGLPTRPDDLKRSLEGCEAVISALNISRNSDFPWSSLRTPPDFLTDSITNVIAQCEAYGVKRVIVMSAYGVAETRPLLPGFFAWLIDHSNISVAYREHESQERLLEKSSLDWTVVRPVGLTNSSKMQKVQVALDTQTKLKMTISRKSAAQFILDCLDQALYARQKPGIAAK